MEKNLFGNKPVVVTGASGVIGTHLSIALAKKGVRVCAVVQNEHSINKAKRMHALYSLSSQEIACIEWCYADITDYQDVYNVIQHAEYVFHCAGYVSFHAADKHTLHAINVEGTKNVVDACLQCGIKKLCHVSSVAALGKAIYTDMIDETCEYELEKKRSLYGYSKYLGELEVWRGIAEGLSAVIVNPSVIIGFANKEQSSAHLFKTILQGMPFYTSGVTGYVSVHDVVDCMIVLMESNIHAEQFVVSAENLSYKTVFTYTAESLGVSAPRIYMPAWILHTVGIILTFLLFLIQKRSSITRHTTHTAYTVSRYSSQKLIHATSFSFRPIRDELARIGALYRTF